MTKLLRLGSVLVALFLVIAACQPAASPSPSPTGTAVATPTAEASATPETSTEPTSEPTPTVPPATEGTLTIWADEVRAPILTAVAADFKAKYGVPVNVYQLGFGDIRDQLKLRAPNNEGPDIIIGAHDWLGELVAAGVVEPLDLGDKSDQFEQVGLNAFSYDGTLYGMPYVSEALALYYNKDLMPDGNPPQTWADLKQIASDLDAAGTTTQALCMQEKDPYHSYPILTGFGGYIFGHKADGSYNPDDVGLDSAGGKAYAEELGSLIDHGLLKPGIGYGDCNSMMGSGQAAFWMTGPWALNDFRASGVNYGVAPIPMMEDQPRPFVGVQGFMVSAFAPNKVLAQTFLTEYVATTETMQALWAADPRIPVWKAVDIGGDADIEAFSASAVNGDPMPAIPQMASVWTAWTNALDLIFTQAQDPDQAVVDAAAQIRELINQ
jgi:maltose-binding protein MalE